MTTSSPALPRVWVIRIFARLEDRYGAAWADRYGASHRDEDGEEHARRVAEAAWDIAATVGKPLEQTECTCAAKDMPFGRCCKVDLEAP
jgi:hypothetical protein